MMLSRPTYNVLSSNNKTDNIIMIAIDNSFSMVDLLKSDVQNTIRKITHNFDETTYVQIILLDNGEVIFEGFNEVSNVYNYNINSTYKTCNIGSIINQINNSNQFLNKYLFIISDGQKNILEGVPQKQSSMFYKERENISILETKVA